MLVYHLIAVMLVLVLVPKDLLRINFKCFRSDPCPHRCMIAPSV